MSLSGLVATLGARWRDILRWVRGELRRRQASDVPDAPAPADPWAALRARLDAEGDAVVRRAVASRPADER